MAKLLLVDDERDLVAVIRAWMQADRYDIDVAYDGQAALDFLLTREYDALILDLGLPAIDGVQILESIRAQGRKTPIIVISGRGAINSKVHCLEAGADDYLTKPFHMRELVCRVKAVLRRFAQQPAGVLHLADVTLDTTNRIVTKFGAELKVTPQEFALLAFLMQHANRAFSSSELLAKVWHAQADQSPDAVRQCVKRVRDKLGDRYGRPLLQTTPSGYRFYVSERFASSAAG
jgi:two-component system OmpR family response regulator